MRLHFLFLEEDFFDSIGHREESPKEESTEKHDTKGTELDTTEPMSEEPISSDFDTDIENEEDYSCSIKMWHDFFEFFMPEDTKHPSSEISYPCTEYYSDSEMKEGDVSSVKSVSSNREYYQDNNWKYLKSS